MRSVPRSRGFLLGVAASTALALAVWFGCSSSVKSDSGSRVDTSADYLPARDRNCKDAEPPTTPEALNACIKGLTFVEEELQGDRQRLMVFDGKPGPACPEAPKLRNCRLGPLGRIQPESLSNQGTDRTLEQQGRIIARMMLESRDEDYPKLAMFRGHRTYWWVKKGTGGAAGISMYISDSVKADGTLYFVKKSLKTERFSGGEFRHPLARWIWVPDDETTKGSCNSSSSCK
jgi:hypothetical protein